MLSFDADIPLWLCNVDEVQVIAAAEVSVELPHSDTALVDDGSGLFRRELVDFVADEFAPELSIRATDDEHDAERRLNARRSAPQPKEISLLF